MKKINRCSSNKFGFISKTISRFLLLFSVMVLFLVSVSSVFANNIASSTLIFEGELTPEGEGYTGTIMATQDFDVYAKEGSIVDADGSSSIHGEAVGSDHDAWPEWYPDVPDAALEGPGDQTYDGEYYALHLDSSTNTWEVWYLATEGDPASGPGSFEGDDYDPYGGSIDWASMYASETEQNWEQRWSGRYENVELEYSGFDVEIVDNGDGTYTVTLTPAPQTIYVDDNDETCGDNSPCYDNIQEAINAAGYNDIISIADGTYVITSTITIDKPLSLIGESEAGVIVDASAIDGYGISVPSGVNDVTIEKLTLIGPQGGYNPSDPIWNDYKDNYGFKITHMNNLVLRDLTVQGSGNSEIDLNTINTATIENIEADGQDTPGFGLMIFNSNDITVTDITTNDNNWAGVSIQNKGQIVNNIIFSGEFNVNDNFPFLIEKDPQSGVYYDITNVDIPYEFNYVVYDFREGDDYKQWYYFGTLEEAKTFAQGLIDSETFTYSGTLIYDVAEENYYVEEGMKIQDAIDAASGTTINVAAGTYDESILLDKSIVLTGEDGAIISGDDSSNYIIKIIANDVVFDNFEVNGGGTETDDNSFDYGIWLKGTDNAEIKNSDIKNVWKNQGNGIEVDDSTNSDIHDNTISSFQKRGIRYLNSDGEFYDNEVIGDNVDGTSRVQNLVNVDDGSSVEIYDNELYNALTTPGVIPTWDSPGIFVSSYAWDGSEADSYANIHDNEIYDCDSGIIVGSVYSTTDGSTADITNNNLHDLEWGINFEVNRYDGSGQN
ncbi:MAG: right-handed parallel beta-helix repeat-containing protein, partial [Candidatus Thorarchaeota archaeon]